MPCERGWRVTRALALRTRLGLGPKSSLERRILGTGVGGGAGRFPLGGGNDGEREGGYDGEGCGYDVSRGVGMTAVGARVWWK